MALRKDGVVTVFYRVPTHRLRLQIRIKNENIKLWLNRLLKNLKNTIFLRQI